MIDWNKSAELNNCSIDELKLRFDKFPKSNKKVYKICNECKKEEKLFYSSLSKSKYPNLCKSCSQKLRQQSPIPKFVNKKDRFIKGTGIDRILTIEKFGYDPIGLKINSHKKIIVVCQQCNNNKIINYQGYNNAKYPNLCISCVKIGKNNPFYNCKHTNKTKKK